MQKHRHLGSRKNFVACRQQLFSELWLDAPLIFWKAAFFKYIYKSTFQKQSLQLAKELLGQQGHWTSETGRQRGEISFGFACSLIGNQPHQHYLCTL